MRIISNFQDYYDSIQQYGIDNKIVFNRINKNNCKFNTEPNYWHIHAAMQQDCNTNHLNLKYENQSDDFKLLEKLDFPFQTYQFPFALNKVTAVINGKAYLNYILTKREAQHEKIILKNASSQDIFKFLKETLPLYEDKVEPHIYKKFKKHNNYESFKKEKHRSYWKNSTSFATTEDLYKIHKKLNTPIFFIIENRHDDYILTNIPLAYLGFNTILNGSIESIAQEISYCIGNILENKNEPPIAISDTLKIEQHGFDKKKSFRHR